MRLTDIAVKNAKHSDKQIKLSDGKGLYLLVHPNGFKPHNACIYQVK